MKTTKKLLQMNHHVHTILPMRTKIVRALFGVAILTMVNAAGFVSTARADEESLQPVQTLLDSTTFGAGNIIVDNPPVDPIITPPDFGNNSFAQIFSPSISQVPEPSTIALGLIGVGALAIASRFRRRSS